MLGNSLLSQFDDSSLILQMLRYILAFTIIA